MSQQIKAKDLMPDDVLRSGHVVLGVAPLFNGADVTMRRPTGGVVQSHVATNKVFDVVKRAIPEPKPSTLDKLEEFLRTGQRVEMWLSVGGQFKIDIVDERGYLHHRSAPTLESAIEAALNDV
jgi:hypothetical protein